MADVNAVAAYDKPLPDLTYIDHRPFWEGTRRHELRIQRCADCGLWRHFPRPMCPRCGSTRAEWPAVTPRGTLYSWTVTHRAMLPAFAGDVPYAIVIVELDEPRGVRLLGNAVDCDPSELRLGMPMEAVFQDVTDEVTLVHWRPVR
ncbi:MAG: Zn-ribbon domain-containing OB-fold protein [Clostridia bacterium]|nr:Zn-ribbon domain-containing OB-fold protein [Clostridia bacterium]